MLYLLALTIKQLKRQENHENSNFRQSICLVFSKWKQDIVHFPNK